MPAAFCADWKQIFCLRISKCCLLLRSWDDTIVKNKVDKYNNKREIVFCTVNWNFVVRR